MYHLKHNPTTITYYNKKLNQKQVHPRVIDSPKLSLDTQVGWPPFVDDFAGHPVLPTHLPDTIVNVIGRSYTHVNTLPHPKWHKTKYTNFMAMNKQREMRFI
jgi:hypothetical protein